MSVPRIAVVGSVNLDLVATGPSLPSPGQTVTGATLAQYPGGKGANQALAARRLGAHVRLIAAVGTDANADAALALLSKAGVELSHIVRLPNAPTGVALIAVSRAGENQIIVAPGANAELDASAVDVGDFDAVIVQLEIPAAAVTAAATSARGMLCLNLAPARDVPRELLERADLLVVNQSEYAFYGSSLVTVPALVARTLGADGAVLERHGRVVARAHSPRIEVVDSTGAGDAFVAAIVVALSEHQSLDAALAFACAAGACAASAAGAQPSLPERQAVLGLLESRRS
jgi:ribokinase